MGLRQAIADQLSDSACSALGDGASFAGIFALASSTIAPELALPAGAAALAMGASYGLFCDRPPPPLSTPPPFTGGQCVGTNYRVQYTVEYSTNFQLGSSSTYTTGADARGGLPGALGAPRISINGDRSSAQLIIPTGNGDEVLFGTSGASGSIDIRSYAIVSVTPQAGGANNCGDLPPTVVTPAPPPVVNRDVTYVTNEGDTITNNYSFAFNPAFIDFNGYVNVPVNITNNDNGDIRINANINLTTGNINFYGGDPSLPPSGNRNPPTVYKPDNNLPSAPVDVPIVQPLPLPTTSPPEKQAVIAGAIVTVLSTPPNISAIFQGDNPTIYAPNLGYINFLILAGESTAWTSDIAIKNKRNFIPCPWQDGAIDVRGTPRPGVEWTISPVYVSQSVE